MKNRALLAPLAAVLLLAAIVLAPGTSGAAAVKPCSSSSLVISAGEEPGGGAAGSVYYRIEFTNLSNSTCRLLGAPKVSAVDLRGKRVGAVASEEPGVRAKPVTLATGTSAVATLRITDALNFPAGRCVPTYAAGLRVGVPGGSGAKVAPLAFRTCSSASVKTLRVAPVVSISSTD